MNRALKQRAVFQRQHITEVNAAPAEVDWSSLELRVLSNLGMSLADAKNELYTPRKIVAAIAP
jgi:hypothetical protein